MIAGNIKVELRATIGVAGTLDPAILLLGYRKNQCQAKAAATARFFGGEAGLENSRSHGRFHAGAGVGNSQPHEFADAPLGMAGQIGVRQRDVLNFKIQMPAMRHGILGVQSQFQQSLAQQHIVGCHGPKFFVRIKSDGNRWFKPRLNILQAIGHQLVKIDRLQSARGSAG